jgi:acyl-CoA synthetase (AMP-forming)/AMP-acid ligase II
MAAWLSKVMTDRLPFAPSAAAFQTYATRPAIIDDTATAWVTYGELAERAETVTQLLKGPRKQLVFCCAPRSVDGVVGYLGATESGHAIAVVDAALPGFDDLVATYQPDWIMAPVEKPLPGDDSSYQMVAWEIASLRLWQRVAPNTGDPYADLFLLLLTSGSTGGKKFVRLSYEAMTDNTLAIIDSLGLSGETCAYLHLPLHYSFGLSVLHTQLSGGGRCVLTERGMMDRDFWNAARTHAVNVFPGVPYHYEMLARLGLLRLDLPQLTMFLQAGGKLGAGLTQQLLAQIRQRDGRFFIMYGQTEAGPRICCLPLHNQPDKIGSVGQVLRGGRLAIEDGEIIYRGRNVMLGYAESRSDLATGDMLAGQLATGDIGQLDGDGYLTITGRKQRFAKLFGNRIDLTELERIASATGSVYAVEMTDHILLVSETGLSGAASMAQIATRTGLPTAWLRMQQVTEIPRLPSGKVDYVTLQGLA